MDAGVILMLANSEEAVIPINEGLFHISQFLCQKRLTQKYCENILLYSNGKIQKISNIRVVGVFGNSVLERICCFLNSTKRIEVDLEDFNIGIDDLFNRVRVCLKNDLASPDPYLPQEKSFDSISSYLSLAKDASDIYSLLVVPNIEDCLDVMV